MKHKFKVGDVVELMHANNFAATDLSKYVNRQFVITDVHLFKTIVRARLISESLEEAFLPELDFAPRRLKKVK